jgi:hypothetical protein
MNSYLSSSILREYLNCHVTREKEVGRLLSYAPIVHHNMKKHYYHIRSQASQHQTRCAQKQLIIVPNWCNEENSHHSIKHNKVWCINWILVGIDELVHFCDWSCSKIAQCGLDPSKSNFRSRLMRILATQTIMMKLLFKMHYCNV